jgi:putative nucleotidyltransferase with HDIG domain
LPFTEKNRQNLLDGKISQLYIPVDNFQNYQKYIETNLHVIIDDETIENETKAKIVYDTSTLIVRDILNHPTVKQNIKRCKKMVENTVAFIFREKGAFHNLLKMMSFDYYTYTHSINVCTFSVALAQFGRTIDLKELHKLGIGALLHDIGKTRISEAVLNKKEPLSPSEVALMKKHPDWGVELLKESNLVSPEVYLPIRQHHEREDGSGYPDGLTGEQIHRFSKIVAIADCFDAMTTRRIYRPALGTFPALKKMFDLGPVFDRQLLEAFTKLMGPRPLIRGNVK